MRLCHSAFEEEKTCVPISAVPSSFPHVFPSTSVFKQNFRVGFEMDLSCLTTAVVQSTD